MVRKQAAQNKTPLPRWLVEKPEVPLGLTFYYRAFVDLSTCRSIGMGEGGIPWTAFNEYANSLRLNEQERHELWEVVRSLDKVYIESRAAKAKIEQNRIGNLPKRRSR